MIANSAHEYEVLYANNLHISGDSIDGLTQHFPCPFCASAEWYAVRLLDFACSTRPIGCTACGRSARFDYRKWADGTTTMQLVQTGGPDPPHWLNPPPPREQMV